MADNSSYPFGLDWYEGNTIKSWDALKQWDRGVQFAYFRIGIGAYASPLELLNACAAQTDWALGGYYVLGLPVVARDTQLRIALAQLAKVGASLSLPVALDFEPQSYLDKSGRRITQWPSVGDLKYVATGIANRGYRTNIYTNEEGLKILKASGLLDWANVDWWFVRCYSFPLWGTEMGVDATLAYLQSKYGIQREHVQFIQTLIDHGDSPIGGGQDFDRAVSWNFEPVPEPEPEPEPTTAAKPYVVTVAGGLRIHTEPSMSDAVVGGIMQNSTVYGTPDEAGNWVQLGGFVSMLGLHDPTSPAEPPDDPAPEPEPQPVPEGAFYRVLHDQEVGPAYKPRQAQPKPDGSFDFHGKPETVRCQVDGAEAVAMTRGMQKFFMGEALRRKAPAGLDVGAAYRSLYRTDRAFNNGQGYPANAGDKLRADFVNGRDESAALPKLLPPVVTGGKIVKRMDDQEYMIAGEPHYKCETLKAGALPSLDVDNIDLVPWHWIPATVGTIISVATGKEDPEFEHGPWRVDPFPQLDGNTVPVPHITNAGYCFIAKRRLVRIADPFQASPYIPERS